MVWEEVSLPVGHQLGLQVRQEVSVELLLEALFQAGEVIQKVVKSRTSQNQERIHKPLLGL